MLQEKILTIIKALRVRYAILIVLLMVAVFWFGIHPWMTNWGSTVPGAYIAIGLAFVLILLAALMVEVTSRSKTDYRAVDKLATPTQ